MDYQVMKLGSIIAMKENDEVGVLRNRTKMANISVGQFILMCQSKIILHKLQLLERTIISLNYVVSTNQSRSLVQLDSHQDQRTTRYNAEMYAISNIVEGSTAKGDTPLRRHDTTT